MAKKLINLICILLITSLIAPAALAQGPEPVNQVPADIAPHVPGEVLISFQPWVNSAQAAGHLAALDLKVKRQVPALGVKLVKLPPGQTVEEALQRISNRHGVEYVEPNYILHISAIQQEEITDQWSLAKIQAPAAWATFNDPDKVPVVLAAVDTGIDPTHTDLVGNVWSNAGEIAGNGLDDDGNGFIDDTWGWDFVNNDSDPIDDNLHGTAVSSVMAGVLDGSGVAGVCPWCKVMPVKVMTDQGIGFLDVVASGITYAADNGAMVINLSLAGPTGAQTLENAINYAWSKGVLVVAGAGNDGANAPMFPAGYDNAMAIAATGEQDTHACFSNYAQDYISVAAPGENILVALPNDQYGIGSGTSLSSPLVAGLGGLLLSQVTDRTNITLKSIIESTAVDLSPPGFDAAFGNGRIDALRAVSNITSQEPPPDGMFSTNGTASGYAHARKLVRDASGTLHVIWHTQDGNLYRIRYATSSDNGAHWDPQEDVYSNPLETYHSALAADAQNLYVAIPRRSAAGAPYQILFTQKPLASGSWSQAEVLMGGTYDAVRPDLYLDPTNGKLHLVASSFDNAPLLYYRSSMDQGETWSEPVTQINPSEGTQSAGANTRYATIHANGDNIFIASRTLSGALFTYYYTHTVRSTDGGQTWFDQTHIASFFALISGEYGLSLAGIGDRLYMGYEVGSNLYFRRFDNGVWSTYVTLETGDANNINKWPTITQAPDGSAWLLWEVNGELFMREYDGSNWAPKEAMGTASYANFKLGTSGDRVEWISTQCNGAPFLLAYDALQLGANNPPQADDQSFSTNEDTDLPITLTGSDPENNPLTFSVTAQPANGTLTGTPPYVTYQPDTDYFGPESFTFVANDGSSNSNPATISITVDPVNDPPTANDDSVNTIEDTPVAITLVGDDVEGSPLTYLVASDPLHGTLTGSAPNLDYSPDLDYVGPDSFTFTVNDGSLDSTPGIISIQVTATNDPPTATNKSVSTNEDTSLLVTLTGSDLENDPLTYSITVQPANGTVTGIPPDVTYQPDADYNGPDSFTFVANDGSSNSNPATISITVDPVNDQPTANDDSVNTTEDISVAITLVGDDVEEDSLSYSIASDPLHGTLNGSAPNLDYLPDLNYFGPDSFTFAVNDGFLDSDPGTISILVSAANDPPTANNQSIATDEDTSLPITLTGSDPDDVILTFSIVTPPSNGTLSGSPPFMSYQPDPEFNGSDSFTFLANDGTADSSSGTVSITIHAVNDAPLANNISDSTEEDTADTWIPDVSDVDGDQMKCSILAPPGAEALASVALDCSSGTYTPPDGISGTDSFSYQVCDLSEACDDAVVSYTISASSLHVGDLDGDSVPAPRSRWNATVTVMVHDAQEDPVAFALVEGSWSAGASGGGSCTSNASGVCEITKTNIKGNVTSATFTIDTITLAALNYKPSDNHDPDADSLGTFIVVNKDSVPQNQLPQASFTYSCSVLTCDFDGTGSSDSDGSIVSHEWDFGDGMTGSGVTPLHLFSVDGTYMVKLTVTDNDGATDTVTQPVTLGATGTQEMHVGDLTGYGEVGRRGRWNALVTITIHGSDDNVLEGATITGVWSTGREMVCTTSSSGYCSLSLSNLKTTVQSVTFTVINVSAPGWEYNANDNHETAITFTQP